MDANLYISTHAIAKKKTAVIITLAKARLSIMGSFYTLINWFTNSEGVFLNVVIL